MTEEETIEIKIPSARKITESFRKNPWVTVSFVLGLFLVLILANNMFFSSSSNSIDKNTAAQNLVSFLNENTNSSVTLESVSAESGLYKVNVNYQGQTIPLYTTSDGKYFIQSIIPLSSESGSSSDSGTPTNTDVSIFLNNPSLYPSLGPKDAKTTVIEFSDFQCPFCGIASGLPLWASQYASQYGDLLGVAGKVEKMAKDGKLKFVYVSMSFLGQESVYAAEAGLCANEQGKFWEMHDAIFTAQTQGENSGKYNKDKLEIIAKGIAGIDSAKFKTCLEGDKYLSAVQQISAEASKAAQGTPTFYVNGKQVSASWSAIQAAIGA